MARIQLVYNNCPRCKKLLVGLNKSLTGCEALRRKYAGLCSDCVTPEEKKEILEAQASSLMNMKVVAK